MSPADAAAHRSAVRRCLIVLVAPVAVVGVAVAGRAGLGWDCPDPALALLLAAAVAVGVLGAIVDIVLCAADLMSRGPADRP